MLSKELLDSIAGYITDDRKEVLEESYRSITEALNDLYFLGVEIQVDDRRISQTHLQDLFEKVGDAYDLKVAENYDSIDFLVCFELGFNEKIAPILRKRRTLKTIYGGLIFAAHRFSAIPAGTTPRFILTEAEVCDELSDAQNARWLCDFRTCFRIIDSLKNRVAESRLSSASKQYWSSSISDLIVEASFTTSNLTNYGRAFTLTDEVINAWREQKNYVKLTHSYLRKSVLYRQMALLEADKKSPLILSLDALLEAEEEIGRRLVALKGQDTTHTLFSLYIELAKAYAQTGVFSSAWRFFHRAERELDTVVDLPSRRRLDLVRTKAVILAEQNGVKNFYEINRIEKCIAEMQQAIDIADSLFSNDLVLRELLIKDLIPLLATIGNSGNLSYKEAAQNLLQESRKKALQLKLFHQIRGLNFIADKYSLHLQE